MNIEGIKSLQYQDGKVLVEMNLHDNLTNNNTNKKR
jgi:hypothetical protein